MALEASKLQGRKGKYLDRKKIRATRRYKRTVAFSSRVSPKNTAEMFFFLHLVSRREIHDRGSI